MRSLLILLLGLGQSVFASDHLKTSYLNRSYVLPEKTNSFEVAYSVNNLPALFSGKNAEEFPGNTNLNYFRHVSWGEDYYIIWSPLPLGIGLRTHNPPGYQSSVQWFVGSSFFDGKFILGPTFEGKTKVSWSKHWGYETILRHSTIIPLDEQRVAWRGEILSGPVFQATSNFSTSIYINPSVSNMLLARLFTKDTENLTESKSYWTVGIWSELTFASQWELRSEARTSFETIESTPEFSGALQLKTYF